MSSLQRRAVPAGPDAGAVDGLVPVMDEAFAKKYPVLLEFLTRVLWEPGQIRQKGTVFFFVEHGAFKACLSDRDADLVAFCTGTTFLGVLDALEKGLAKNNLDWRPSSQGKAKRGK